jgi:cobalt-zinc-cadmium resistance protein CzcA
MVVAKIGSAEIPTDPMPVEAADLIILLKDKSEWTSAETKEELMEKMEAALNDIPGATTEFSQPIQMRFNELMTGVRSDVAVKIFGEDIDLLVGKGDEVLKIVSTVDGVTDAKAERVAGLPQITVRYNKDKLALYGLKIGELNKVLRMGFAGESAGVIYEGEKRFDLVVRLAENSRGDISNIKSLFVTLPSGNQIPLEQIADVQFEDGPMQISREDGKRRIVVGFNVRGRDVESVVEDIREKLDANLKLPAGYYVTYGGQFENLVDANKRLAIAVPVALALILVLLFFTFKSMKQALLIFTAIPLSAIGGVLALWMRGMPFSISAGVGFIALFGVAVLNGIVLIGYFNQLKSEGMENILDRIREGTKVRLRPVIMTAAVASLGFLPMALSTSAGAEVQKPLATVVIGGLITATLLTLIVLPILYYFVERGVKGKPVAATILFLGFLLPLNGSAQEKPLSIDRALELAYKNNQSLRASQLDVQAQNKLVGAAWDIPKTEIAGTFGQINSLAQDRNISISQSINPFKIGATRKLLKENSSASQLRSDATKQQIAFSVRESWNNLLYYGKLNSILTKQSTVMDKFVRSADVKFRVGETNSLEKNVATAKQLELQQRIRQNEAQMKIERSRLKLYLNLKDELLIADTSFVPLPSGAMVDSTALKQNPEFKLAEKQVDIATATQKAEQAALWPDISAGYFIQSITGNQDVDGTPRYYDDALRFQGFTAGISVPIFFGSSVAKAKAAKINIEREKENAAYIQSELKSRLVEQAEQLATYEALITYYRDTAEPNAQKITANATKAYQNGDVSYVEYVQNLETANSILVNYADAVRQYNQTIINIQYLTNQ